MVELQGLLLESMREAQRSSDEIDATPGGEHPAKRHALVCCALLRQGLATLNDVVSTERLKLQSLSSCASSPVLAGNSRAGLRSGEEVAARMRAVELEEKVASLEVEMRSRDEEAEKMLVLLHEQLTLEQKTRKDLQEEVRQLRQRRQQHQASPADRKGDPSSLAARRPLEERLRTPNLSGSFVRLPHLDEAQGMEPGELLAEVSRLQGELRVALQSAAREEMEAQGLAAERDQIYGANLILKGRVSDLESQLRAFELEYERTQQEDAPQCVAWQAGEEEAERATERLKREEAERERDVERSRREETGTGRGVREETGDDPCAMGDS